VDEESVNAFLPWFEKTGQEEKAASIRKNAVAGNPQGRIAEASSLKEITAQKDDAKKAMLLEKLIADFPQSKNLQTYNRLLYIAYSQSDQPQKAFIVAENMRPKNPNLYNDLAWESISKGEDLEKAVGWVKRGIEVLQKEDESLRPLSWTPREWKKNSEFTLGAMLDTYGYGLNKLGRTAEALRAFEEAFDRTKGNDPDINARLIESYVTNGQYEKAVEVATGCIRSGKSNDALVEHFRMAFTKQKGNDKEFNDVVAEARDFAKKERREKMLKSRINKPATDFTLKKLDGGTVTLSALRGKVVVLDFWATWCGPCQASFPFLQKVYEKYKDNPDVVILAMDTWERVKADAREGVVRKFIENHGYTFPVVFDDNEVEKYGVEGIPTKFLIDKKGMIQFKDVGFYTGEEMVDALEIAFDILLSDEFYSSR